MHFNSIFSAIADSNVVLLPFAACRNKQKPVQVRVCDRKGRFRQGVEGRVPQGEQTFCHEGDGKGAHHFQTQCQFSHEREKVPLPAQSPVSAFVPYTFAVLLDFAITKLMLVFPFVLASW